MFVILAAVHLRHTLISPRNHLPPSTKPHPRPKMADRISTPATPCSLRGRLDLDLRSWHEKYDGVVRPGPDEVTFITAQAWKDIYGHGHLQLPKVQISTINGKNIFATNDVDHARFRKALSHAFSAKGLQAQECLVTRYIDKRIERLKGFTESGTAADMGKW
ncbi:hypothetical protein V6000_004644 [Aspergillus fumigatus]